MHYVHPFSCVVYCTVVHLILVVLWGSPNIFLSWDLGQPNTGMIEYCIASFLVP